MTAPSDKELRRLLAHANSEDSLPFHARDLDVLDSKGFGAATTKSEDLALLFALAPDMARELLAARKVVRAANELMQCTSLFEDQWFTCRAAVLTALAAYDKARKR